jgi:membrane protein implicated in regulation of membrane protease activity
MEGLGRALIIVGGLLLLLGLVIVLGGRIPWLGNLPGDIHIQRDNFSFHFPLVTCLLLSVILTVIVNVVLRLLRG